MVASKAKTYVLLYSFHCRQNIPLVYEHAILDRELARPGWKGEVVALGTATDPYQPVEGRLRLTRRILEVLARRRNPVSITTKSPLVLRDLDLLLELRETAGCQVNFSVGTLNEQVWNIMEPGTPHPRSRLRAMARLVEAGIDAGILMAPILPHLSDAPKDMKELVREALGHGARFVSPIVLRLPAGAREWYLAELRRRAPKLAARYRRLYPGANAPASYVRKIETLVAGWKVEFGVGSGDTASRNTRPAQALARCRKAEVFPGAERPPAQLRLDI